MLISFAACEALRRAVGVLKPKAIDGDEHAKLTASRGDVQLVICAIVH